LFHTTVERTDWDETTGRWTVATDRGDKMRARYVVLANGILTTPKLARIAGMESFTGTAFHTSRWDYTVDLEGKRVGIIGTGATAVQVIPEIAKAVNRHSPDSVNCGGRDRAVGQPRQRKIVFLASRR
jgi:cation diffusion facilitator CzcD-associated flavoprotein CzcO